MVCNIIHDNGVMYTRRTNGYYGPVKLHVFDFDPSGGAISDHFALEFNMGHIFCR